MLRNAKRYKRLDDKKNYPEAARKKAGPGQMLILTPEGSIHGCC